MKYQKKNYTKQEIITGIRKQLKIHPDCMDSPKKWDSYNDRLFCAGVIYRRFGWNKAKVLLDLPVDIPFALDVLSPLLIRHKHDNNWLANVFGIICCKINKYYKSIIDRKFQLCLASNKKFTKDDIGLAKQCLVNLGNECKQKNKIC